MSEGTDNTGGAPPPRKPLTTAPRTTLTTTGAGTVRQEFARGRTNQVVVEMKQKRVVGAPGAAGPRAPIARPTQPVGPAATPPVRQPLRPAAAEPATTAPSGRTLSETELAARQRAIADARATEESRRAREETEAAARARRDAEERRALEQQREAEDRENRRRELEETLRRKQEAAAAAAAAAQPADGEVIETADGEATGEPAFAPGSAEDIANALGGRIKKQRVPLPDPRAAQRARMAPKRRDGRLTVVAALADEDERQRSMSSVRRAREREREKRMRGQESQARVVREVIVPEVISVQDLAQRMAERAVDVIRYLMRQGTMSKPADMIDADTAELIVSEFGHTAVRVSESDVEEGIEGEADTDINLEARPPIVTIMGHVDHGKTSLLDAIRSTDVVSGEAGGITQHIGAYQVRLASGERVTFLDTPGHAAFSAMRARGASATDIVILVVAADDGVMPQTIEAIAHAKAADVPIIVAVNKIDKEGAEPQRVLTDLLQHEIVVETFGGDVQFVEVSATKKIGLDKLLDAILLQAEVLELKANPNRTAEGVVVESELDKGKGAVATLLVKRGTLKRGDIVVAGSQWGRVRALSDERNAQLKEAGPSLPAEVLGLDGAPAPGDVFVVVENEMRAREITEFRARQRRERQVAGAGSAAKASLEAWMAERKGSTNARELPIVLKADVQGSAEAITQALEKLGNEEVRARVIHQAVGQINETDVLLAKTSNSPIVGFNVRANSQARDLAEREGIEIRYYAIIYDLIEDMKGVLGGLLAPVTRETFLGNAEILEVFNITKVGRIAGCRITEGKVQRGARIRLIRDGTVIHEGGLLKTLKRFKDDANEVQVGQECGMGFENYQDLKQGDVIECYTLETIQRTLD
jgi:translation initiation factor IF-2